jgi:hypothetical protein
MDRGLVFESEDGVDGEGGRFKRIRVESPDRERREKEKEREREGERERESHKKVQASRCSLGTLEPPSATHRRSDRQ